MCLGNKERVLGVQFSPCGKYLATAGQDSTVRVFETKSNRLLSTLVHNKKCECLRVAWASETWASESLDRSVYTFFLATGSADGVVRVYHTKDPAMDDWEIAVTLDHADMPHFQSQDPDDKPQIYALQFIDDYKALPNSSEVISMLLTSSDDHVHLWELDVAKRSKQESENTSQGKRQNIWSLNEVMSLYFADMHEFGYGVHVGQVTTAGIARASQVAGVASSSAFGGDRNPNGLVYVFDASYCATNALLGAALSDGSLRLMNGRGVCISLIQLPGPRSHLTSFAWDPTGSQLATCVATGHLITWRVTLDQHGNLLRTSCDAVLEGGHAGGRPLFGAAYCGKDRDLIMSWGIDGRICLWDSRSRGELGRPLSILFDRNDYPLYALDLRNGAIVAAGGNDVGGFVGIPVFVYKIAAENAPGEQTKKARHAMPEKG